MQSSKFRLENNSISMFPADVNKLPWPSLRLFKLIGIGGLHVSCPLYSIDTCRQQRQQQLQQQTLEFENEVPFLLK